MLLVGFFLIFGVGFCLNNFGLQIEDLVLIVDKRYLLLSSDLEQLFLKF
jgi:hypothetical protein